VSGVADFEAYRRRAERMEALERVLKRARDVFAASRSGVPEIMYQALSELRLAMLEVDKLPPRAISRDD
jgi:hypothetical protein